MKLFLLPPKTESRMDTGSKSESSETSKETPTCEQKQADGFTEQCRSRIHRIWLFQILEEAKIRG